MVCSDSGSIMVCSDEKRVLRYVLMKRESIMVCSEAGTIMVCLRVCVCVCVWRDKLTSDAAGMCYRVAGV